MGKNKGASKCFPLIRQETMQLYETWLQWMFVQGYAPNTMIQYPVAVRVFLSWNYEYNKDKPLHELLNRDYTLFIAYLKINLSCGPKRIKFYKSALVCISKYIEKNYEDIYPTFKNRASNIDTIPNHEVHEKIIIKPDELQYMLDTLVENKKYQEACWLAILANSGCRRSEAIQLKVQWFSKEYEHFPEPYTMFKTPPIRTKGRGVEGKVIPKYIFKKPIMPYLELWLAERERRNINSEWLFYSPMLNKPNESTANSFAATIRKMFNNGFHNHCMRHYFATQLRANSYPDTIIQKLVKWNDLTMIDHYDDTSDEEIIDRFFTNRKEQL